MYTKVNDSEIESLNVSIQSSTDISVLSKVSRSNKIRSLRDATSLIQVCGTVVRTGAVRLLVTIHPVGFC